jgi:hypothetical protein
LIGELFKVIGAQRLNVGGSHCLLVPGEDRSRDHEALARNPAPGDNEGEGLLLLLQRTHARPDLPRMESTTGLGEDVRYCSGSVLVVSAVVRYPAFAKLCR